VKAMARAAQVNASSTQYSAIVTFRSKSALRFDEWRRLPTVTPEEGYVRGAERDESAGRGLGRSGRPWHRHGSSRVSPRVDEALSAASTNGRRVAPALEKSGIGPVRRLKPVDVTRDNCQRIHQCFLQADTAPLFNVHQHLMSAEADAVCGASYRQRRAHQHAQRLPPPRPRHPRRRLRWRPPERCSRGIPCAVADLLCAHQLPAPFIKPERAALTTAVVAPMRTAWSLSCSASSPFWPTFVGLTFVSHHRPPPGRVVRDVAQAGGHATRPAPGTSNAIKPGRHSVSSPGTAAGSPNSTVSARV
jgi:hypothetical protein